MPQGSFGNAYLPGDDRHRGSSGQYYAVQGVQLIQPGRQAGRRQEMHVSMEVQRRSCIAQRRQRGGINLAVVGFAAYKANADGSAGVLRK